MTSAQSTAEQHTYGSAISDDTSLMPQVLPTICNVQQDTQGLLYVYKVQYWWLQLQLQLSLWLQEHVRQIGGFLLQIGDPTASNVQDAVAAMQALTGEAFKLIQCLLHNPVANKVLVASRLDDGSPAVNSLADEFYVTLLVGALQKALNPEAFLTCP